MRKKRPPLLWRCAFVALVISWTLHTHADVTGVFQRSAEYQPADSAVEALVRDALRDRIAQRALLDQEAFQNRGLLGRVAVRREMPEARLTLSPQALPDIPSVKLSLIQRADATFLVGYEPFYYVVVDLPQITDDAASLLIGTEGVSPAGATHMTICCCVAVAHFQRRDGRWTFVRWGERDCPIELRRMWDDPQ